MDASLFETRIRVIEELDSAIERGRTLPASFYTDQQVLELERHLIFRRNWQLVGSTSDLAKPGDYVSTEIGGVPIVVVRDKQGEVRGFVNVCRHRAHIVVEEGCGNKSLLQCPYHAWTYDLDGSLRAAPRSGDEPNFDLSDFPLVAIQVAVWGPLLFANLDPEADSFHEQFAEMKDQVVRSGLQVDGMLPRATETWDINCNWKIIYENAAECYHCPTIHPGFGDDYGISPADYQMHVTRDFVHHVSPVKEHARDSGALDWEMFAAFPNWYVTTGAHPGVMMAVRSMPGQPGVTHRAIFACASEGVDDAVVHEELTWWLQIARQEDGPACERVYRGLASGMVSEGPLLLESEYVIQKFQRRLREALAEEALTPA